MGLNWKTAAFVVALIIVGSVLATYVQDQIDKANSVATTTPPAPTNG